MFRFAEVSTDKLFPLPQQFAKISVLYFTITFDILDIQWEQFAYNLLYVYNSHPLSSISA